jgi:hypothetical protein
MSAEMKQPQYVLNKALMLTAKASLIVILHSLLSTHVYGQNDLAIVRYDSVAVNHLLKQIVATQTLVYNLQYAQAVAGNYNMSREEKEASYTAIDCSTTLDEISCRQLVNVDASFLSVPIRIFRCVYVGVIHAPEYIIATDDRYGFYLLYGFNSNDFAKLVRYVSGSMNESTAIKIAELYLNTVKYCPMGLHWITNPNDSNLRVYNLEWHPPVLVDGVYTVIAYSVDKSSGKVGQCGLKISRKSVIVYDQRVIRAGDSTKYGGEYDCE